MVGRAIFTKGKSMTTSTMQTISSSMRRCLRGSLRVMLSLVGLGLIGCGGSPKVTTEQVVGQSDFSSRPPQSGGPNASAHFDVANGAAAPLAATSSSSTTTPRTVEETDLYRLDGNRLYYLNAYRGLMVFDITNVDAPKFLGRSPIYGSPIEMV